jgi:Family of unknown function (DUF6074)
MCMVLPFPRAKNRPYVMRQALRMAAMTQKGAEGHLTYQLTIFRGSLLRRGLDPHLIDSHARDLEESIRAEFEKMTLATGDVA